MLAVFIILVLMGKVATVAGMGIPVSLATSVQCPSPNTVHVDTDTGIVYAACESGGIVSINGRTVTTLATLTQCPKPQKVFVNKATGTVYAACFTITGMLIISISGSTVTLLATVPSCLSLGNMFVESTTQIIYLTCPSSGGDSRIVTIDGGLLTSIGSGTCPSGVVYDSVYVSSWAKTVYSVCGGDVVSFNTNGVMTKIATINNCYTTDSLYFNNATSLLYTICTSWGSDGVYTRTLVSIPINGGRLAAVATFSSKLCYEPTSLSGNSVTGIMYVTCHARPDPSGGSSAAVISIDGTSVTTLLTSAQCSAAYSVFTDSSTGIVYAACQDGGIVAVNPTGCTVPVPRQGVLGTCASTLESGSSCSISCYSGYFLSSPSTQCSMGTLTTVQTCSNTTSTYSSTSTSPLIPVVCAFAGLVAVLLLMSLFYYRRAKAQSKVNQPELEGICEEQKPNGLVSAVSEQQMVSLTVNTDLPVSSPTASSGHHSETYPLPQSQPLYSMTSSLSTATVQPILPEQSAAPNLEQLLASLGISEQHVKVLQQHEIDEHSIMLLQEQDLRNLLPLGPAMTILHFIQNNK